MPCPGSDKAFYREVGLAPAKPASVANSPAVTIPTIVGPKSSDQISVSAPTPTLGSPNKSLSLQVDCKPQIHKKTGISLPCPAPD